MEGRRGHLALRLPSSSPGCGWGVRPCTLIEEWISMGAQGRDLLGMFGNIRCYCLLLFGETLPGTDQRTFCLAQRLVDDPQQPLPLTGPVPNPIKRFLYLNHVFL